MTSPRPHALVLHAEHAWLGGESASRDVRVEVRDGTISSVTAGVPAVRGDEQVAGVLMPGFVNAHSHAFHRALRGRTHAGAGDFWAWRDLMYRVAGSLEPDTYESLATAVYGEMALAGITAVGEFHYVHHRPDGTPYDDPHAMSRALVRAARAAGIRLVVLDVGYLHASITDPAVRPEQRRFADRSVDAWLERVAAFRAAEPTVCVGLAPHSVRAVHPDELARVAAARATLGGPVVHVHVSEQPAENEAALAATGRTPTRLLADAGLLGGFATAVHATHLTDEDVALLGASGTHACICPTTERDLADGIGPTAALRDAGTVLCLGTDSHAVVDPFEEARAVEAHQRVTSLRRGTHPSGELLAAATSGGAASLGLGPHAIHEGAPADLVAIALDSVRLATFDASHAAAHLVHAAGAADVRDVWVGGVRIVRDSVHLSLGDVAGALRRTVAAQLR
jgi:formiminoglutamate deiminase